MKKQNLVVCVVSLLGGAVGGWALKSAYDERTLRGDPVEIATLLASPSDYAGKRVRLKGKLTECYEWECSICPEAMVADKADPKQCLALGFRSLMSGTGFGADDKEAIFRFASVTLVADFDPTCLRMPCLDRASVLENADVLSVEKRRSSRDGLWMGKTTALRPMPEPQSTVIEAAVLEAGLPGNQLTRVFRVEGDANTAVACSLIPVRGAHWPESLEGALFAKTVNDFYECLEAHKLAGRWVVQAYGPPST